jgi:hypothetical protein
LVAVAAGTGLASEGLSGLQAGAGAELPSQKLLSAVPASASETLLNEQGQVNVGKLLTVTSEAGGKAIAKGYYATTNVSGDVSETVPVPMGTDDPVNLTSVQKLNMDGQSIVYDVNNSGSDVQSLIASGGQYNDQLPVTVVLEVLVNGERIDPNSVSTVTGDIELLYHMKNHTNRVQTVTYKDAPGATQSTETNVPVPMSADFAATFATGWADISAPWANTGFSTGQEITGSQAMLPDAANSYDPGTTFKITARAQGATIPKAVINVVPADSSGLNATVASAEAKGGSAANKLLGGEAIPLLSKVQQALGTATGEVANVLTNDVNPILDKVATLQQNPKEINAKIEGYVADAKDGIGAIFGVNALFASLFTEADKLKPWLSEKSEKNLGKMITKIETLKKESGGDLKTLNEILGVITQYGGDLNQTVDDAIKEIFPGKTDTFPLYSMVYVELRKTCVATDNCMRFAWPPHEPSLLKAFNQQFVTSTKTKTPPFNGYSVIPDGVTLNPPIEFASDGPWTYDCLSTPTIPCGTYLGGVKVKDAIDNLAINRIDGTCTDLDHTGRTTFQNWWNSPQTGADKKTTKLGKEWWALAKTYAEEKHGLPLSKKYLYQHGTILAKMNAFENEMKKPIAPPFPQQAECDHAAAGIVRNLDALLESAQRVGNDVTEILPEVEILLKAVGPAVETMKELQSEIPVLRKLLFNPCSATSIEDDLSQCGLTKQMALVEEANRAAQVATDAELDHLQQTLEPVIDGLLVTWNKVVGAALPIEKLGNEIPGLISQIAYGDVGSLVGTAENMEDLALKLTNAGNKAVAINAAMDKRFHQGDGFPYGAAEGESVVTNAQYNFTTAPSGTKQQPVGSMLGFAILLLILGGGLGTWLHMRNAAAV